MNKGENILMYPKRTWNLTLSKRMLFLSGDCRFGKERQINIDFYKEE